MLSPRNATIARSPRSATARRSAASTGSPRRIGSPASPVMNNVVSISSGAAATPGGGSERGGPQALTSTAMATPRENLTSITVGRQCWTTPSGLVRNEEGPVANDGDPLWLAMAPSHECRPGDDAAIRSELDDRAFASGDEQPVSCRRISLDARRVERRHTRRAGDKIGSHAHAHAVDERPARNGPCEDGDHAAQRLGAWLLTRDEQRISARIDRQSLHFAQRTDPGVVRAKGNEAAVHAGGNHTPE